MRERDDERGFTLVEVLVSLVIAGLLVAILLNGAATAQSRLRAADVRRKAVFVAENLLEEKAVAPFGAEPHDGTRGGFAWAVDEQIVQADPRGLFALVELHARIASPDGRALFEAHTRKLKALPRT